jgi:thioredoxin 1
MSFASSNIIKRTLLTSTAALKSTTPSPRSLNRLYHPLISQKSFYATMGKQGVHNLQSKKEFDDALGEKGLMVLDCFATWCGPCKVIAPKVVE